MAKIKKVVFIFEFPFCARDYERFGVEVLKGNGLDVEVWDLSPILHREAMRQVRVPDPAPADSYISFSAYADLRPRIAGLDDSCFIICLAHYMMSSYQLYKLISMRGLKYCVGFAASYPLDGVNLKREITLKTAWDKIMAKLKNRTPAAMINRIFLSIPFGMLGIRAADMILAASGEKAYFSSYPIDAGTEVLWAHYFDYDIYLDKSGEGKPAEDGTAVFLDSYLPFHPEFIFSKKPHPISPERYYPDICKFFDYIEDVLSLKVVIAAHPRSNYEGRDDYFGSRLVLRGQTPALVKRARLVLAHSSYALNFAALFKKPVIFLTTDELNSSVIGTETDIMAELFGKRVINLSRSMAFDPEEELKIDAQKYERYKHRYIKKAGTPEAPFWQIVADRIMQFN